MVSQSIVFNLRIVSRTDKDEESAIFLMIYILDFMHYTLANFNDIKMKGNTTPAQELQLFIHKKFPDTTALITRINADLFSKATQKNIDQ